MSSTIARTSSHTITFTELHGSIPRYALKENEFGAGFVSMSPAVYQEFVAMVMKFPSLPAGSGGIKHDEGGSTVRLSFSGAKQSITVSFMRGRGTESKIVLNQEHVEELQSVL